MFLQYLLLTPEEGWMIQQLTESERHCIFETCCRSFGSSSYCDLRPSSAANRTSSFCLRRRLWLINHQTSFLLCYRVFDLWWMFHFLLCDFISNSLRPVEASGFFVRFVEWSEQPLFYEQQCGAEKPRFSLNWNLTYFSCHQKAWICFSSSSSEEEEEEGDRKLCKRTFPQTEGEAPADLHQDEAF